MQGLILLSESNDPGLILGNDVEFGPQLFIVLFEKADLPIEGQYLLGTSWILL